MNLKDYFQQKKEITVSNVDKLDIYQKFISRRNQKSFYAKKQFFGVKAFSYSVIFLFLIIWLYWTYFFNWDIIINSDWFFLQNNNWIQWVQANYIAKVIDFNWNFYIQNNWKYYQSSFIQDWDTITLKKDSELLIYIDKSTESKIIWPAKFIINKNWENYKINLIYWDFIKIKSLEESNPQKIEILTKNFSIKQKDNKALNFEISKNWEQVLLKNEWAKLLLTHTENNLEKSIEINPDKTLSIQENDISILDTKKLWQAINDNNISQTLSFNYNSQEIKEKEDIDSFIKNFSNDISANWETKEVSQNIWINLNQKSIPNESQISKLDTNISKSILIKDIENITKTYLLWDENLNSKLNILNNKLSNISNSFSVNNSYLIWESYIDKINSINTNSINIVSKIEENYHLPNRYINNIKNISIWLNQLKKYDYWQFKENIDDIVIIISNIKSWVNFE